MRHTILLALGLLALASAPAIPAEKGPETGLDLPRYVSLKASKANVRRGPSLSHRVDWEFLRRGMPLQVTAEFGHWRRVRDMDDATGWVHYSLLSGHRTAIILGSLTALHDEPSEGSRVNAYVEQGVVVDLEACEEGWCEVDADGYSGWLPKAEVWGVDRDEIFD
jgi:SH3-like domain-containing protein